MIWLPKFVKRAYNRAEDFLFDHTPRILLTDTFQAITAIAFLGLGIGSILVLISSGAPGVIGHALPSDWLRALWGISMASGGAAQIFGLQFFTREVERFGLGMSFVGSVVYMCALWSNALTAAGLILGFLFAMYAVGYWIFLRASARAKRRLDT